MTSFALTKHDTAVIKGIAILAMLFHHVYGTPPAGVESYTGIPYIIGVLGKVCVALFLFCSGYGLAKQYKPISIKDDVKFIARRLIKFYANYWFIFVLFVPISVFVFHQPDMAFDGDKQRLSFALILDILGLSNTYNVTWWFNRIIIILYLLFPILYRCVRIAPWFAILVGMAIVRYETHLPDSLSDICICQLPFVMGIVWQMYEDKLPQLTTWLAEHRYVYAICSFILLAITIVLRMYPIIPHWSGMRMDAFVSCAFVLVVISIVRYMPHLMDVFSYLGKHSINIYLFHTFLLGYWLNGLLYSSEWLRGGGNITLLVIGCLVISIGIEYIKEKIGFYKLIKYITRKT